jgi:hypothetical protein
MCCFFFLARTAGDGFDSSIDLALRRAAASVLPVDHAHRSNPAGCQPSRRRVRRSRYILTGEQMTRAAQWPLERDPYLLETSVPGIFACGDVRFNSIKRFASGVGEGSMPIAFIHQYLAQTETRR